MPPNNPFFQVHTTRPRSWPNFWGPCYRVSDHTQSGLKSRCVHDRKRVKIPLLGQDATCRGHSKHPWLGGGGNGSPGLPLFLASYEEIMKFSRSETFMLYVTIPVKTGHSAQISNVKIFVTTV